MSRQVVVLEPRDGFFLKDGRGWTTTSVGQAGSIDWPFPGTVAGALRTAWGLTHLDRSSDDPSASVDWRRDTAAIQLSALLPLRRARASAGWDAGTRMWPVPADALYLEGGAAVHRLEPVARDPDVGTLGSDDDAAREAMWWAAAPAFGKPLPAPRWWTDEQFTSWLGGGGVIADVDESLRPLARTIVQVAIEPNTRAAAESMLFATEVVETQGRDHEWALGVRVAGADKDRPLPRVVLLGGDRRIVHARSGNSDIFNPPMLCPPQGTPGLRLVVVTPLCSDGGWCLPDFVAAGVDEPYYLGRLPGVNEPVRLRAAMVPRPAHVSGWDMARNEPKPTLRLVPPGAVYFVEKESMQAFTVEETTALWLTQLGKHRDLGYGVVVAGVWGSGGAQ